jgi:5-deoxy-glucuronate isomerase
LSERGNGDNGSFINLLHQYHPVPGYSQLVGPPDHGLAMLNFGVLSLAAGQSFHYFSDDHEVALVILTGRCSVQNGDVRYQEIGGRQSVFDGRATAIYMPRDSAFVIEACAGGVEVALCMGPSERSLPPRLITPDKIIVHDRGGFGFRRYVHDIIGPDDEAETLLVGETFTPACNWSGYPPHKHDREDPPHEAALEEVYFYKVRPEHGFGIQYIYSSDDPVEGIRPPINQAYALRHNDFAVVPYGYHPVAAPPGYDVYYLWFLVGRTRLLKANEDPAHKWIAEDVSSQRSFPR